MSTSSLHLPNANLDAASSLKIPKNSGDHDSALEIAHVPAISSLSAEHIKSDSRYDLHALPTYLSARSRRPSALNRQDSDISILKDAYRLEVLHTEPATTSTSGDVESTHPSAGAREEATNSTANLLSPQQKRASLIQFLAICWCAYLIGWNDGTAGPLLPRVQEEYHVLLADMINIF